MCRYGVRFLAAILTFSIGVALSLVFGLFTVSDHTSFQHYEWSRPSRPKATRIVQVSPYKVDNAPTTPLHLVYLGSNNGEEQLQVGVENRSDKTISGYVISAGRTWDAESAQKFFDWSSLDVLKPGEMRVITAPREAYGLSLRVTKVDFQDGSVWMITPGELNN